MKLKTYLLTGAAAALASLILTLLMMLFSVMSWVIVWALFTFLLIPIIMKGIKFWNEHNCIDLDDFWEELNEVLDKSNKNNRIE